MTSSALTVTTCTRTLLLAGALALGTAAAAQASTFTWEFSGMIEQPTGANPVGDNIFDSIVKSGGGDDPLLWGTLTEAGTSTGAAFSSSLSIIGGTGSEVLASGVETEVKFGEISWTNKSTFNSGGIWDVVLSLSGTFGHQGFGSVTDTASLLINMDNTEDGDFDPAKNNASGKEADLITFLSLSDLGFEFSSDLGGGMTLLGFSAQLLRPGQCGDDNPDEIGSTLFGNVWSNCEGNTSVLGLYASVRYDPLLPPPPTPTAAIPLPAAGWLLLGGLAALGAAARRRRAA